jgi:hypothetical protein
MHLELWNDVIECCDNGLRIGEDSEFYNIKGRAEGRMGNYEEKVRLI